MNNRRCALILYSKGMQDSAALATAEYLEKAYPKQVYACPISDDELTSWKYTRLRRKSYVVACRNFAFINKWTCGAKHILQNFRVKKTKRPYKEFKRPTDGAAGWWYKLGTKYRKVYNAVMRFEPDLVLCTTPELLEKALKAKHMLEQPHMSVCALITDYQLDKLFINHKANGYFVQNINIKQSLETYGIEEEAIVVVGTPIISSVKAVHERANVLQEFELAQDRANIVIVGGRYGNSRIKEVFSKCLEVSDEYNIVLLTGGSESIGKYCTYAATSKKKVDNIYIVDDVEDMSKIYAIADVLITVPTAQITYEAMYHNKKMIVLKGGDKIENLNAHFLTSNNLALRGLTPDEVMASLLKFAEDSAFCAELMANQQAFAIGDGAKLLGEIIATAMAVHFEAKQEILKKREEIAAESLIQKTDTLTKKGATITKPVSKPISKITQMQSLELPQEKADKAEATDKE